MIRLDLQAELDRAQLLQQVKESENSSPAPASSNLTNSEKDTESNGSKSNHASPGKEPLLWRSKGALTALDVIMARIKVHLFYAC